MIPDSKFFEIMSKATSGIFDEHELGITGIASGAKQFARHIAIDFFNWQKKDYAECCADMSAEEWFDKYLKSKK